MCVSDRDDDVLYVSEGDPFIGEWRHFRCRIQANLISDHFFMFLFCFIPQILRLTGSQVISTDHTLTGWPWTLEVVPSPPPGICWWEANDKVQFVSTLTSWTCRLLFPGARWSARSQTACWLTCSERWVNSRAEDRVGEHVSHSLMGILLSEGLLLFQTCGGTSGMNVEHTWSTAAQSTLSPSSTTWDTVSWSSMKAWT